MSNANIKNWHCYMAVCKDNSVNFRYKSFNLNVDLYATICCLWQASGHSHMPQYHVKEFY